MWAFHRDLSFSHTYKLYFYSNHRAFINLFLSQIQSRGCFHIKKKPLGFAWNWIPYFSCSPISFIIIFSTVVGIPLALILLASYLITIYLARIYVVFWTGVTIFERLGKKVHEGWALVVGLIIYFMLTLIPIIGGIITFFVLLFGLGAAILTKKELYQT